ncbi:MAG: ABC transporter permease [Oscillospiraceae bacterium]
MQQKRPVEEPGFLRRFWRELRKKPGTLFCLTLLLLIALASVFAFLSPYDPYELNAAEKLCGLSSAHWFGTDEYGRDYFTRALYGGRVSLSIGVLSMLISVTVGTAIGLFSGYIGEKVDTVVMRLTDIFLALPSMLLIVIINAFLHPGIVTLILVLSLFSWANVARIVRAETMSLKERDFVIAAQNLGVSGFRIAVSHILPNVLGSVIVSASLNVATAILMESALSYLGLGVSIPYASWGSMLQGAQKQMLSQPLLSVFPGVLILITVLGFNLLGETLHNVLEAKSSK